MLSLIRHLLLTRNPSIPPQVRSHSLQRQKGLTAGAFLLAVSALWSGGVAQAQTTLPGGSGLNFQTSAPRRCADIGDWYTTAGIGDNATGACGTQFGGGPDTIGEPGIHSFSISITQADLDNAGGSVVVTINDAESNNDNNDPIIGDETNDAPDPTRFALLLNGVEIASQIFDNAPDGTNFSFPPITVPGLYVITSQTGALPIFGDDTLELNNDDNSFQISVPIDNLLIGQIQGSFQQDSGGNIDVDLFFLVGPDAEQLFLRNFDLDGGGTISYEDPQGGVTLGTTSENENWNGFDPFNGGPDLNFGGDTVDITPVTQAGVWTLGLTNYTENNQTILEANERDPVTGALTPLVLLDQPPLLAGNFTITPDTTLTTTVGVEVCHPFTVINNFFTSDIINLELEGTDPNFTVELRDAAGTTPLVDTDGDGRIDTGILQPGESRDFNLCVTPQPGAPDQDVTIINGTSFLDETIRQQAVADGLPGADPNPDVQSVTKTTLISTASEVGLAKDFSSLTPVPGQPGVFNLGITYVIANTGTSTLSNLQITDNLQAVLIANPTVNGTPGNGADSFTVQSVVLDAFSGDAANAPTANTAFDGNADQNLFTAAPNTFAVGDVATITVIVQVDISSDGLLETENSANASATDPNGAVVTDVSQDGSDVDPDGDGNPTNNSDSTPLEVGPPEIGLAKLISTPTAVAGQPGVFNFDITFTVTNTGGATLNNVQITDNLQAVLIDNPTVSGEVGNGADSFSVLGVVLDAFTGNPANAPTANAGFDGNTDQNLFTAAPNTFLVGDTARITITVQVDLSSDGTLETENSAEATGADSAGTVVNDISQDGEDVDPDGDGTADDDTPSLVSISPEPSLAIVKRITNIFRQGIPLSIQGVTTFQDDPTSVDNALQNTFAAAGIPNQPAGILELPEGFELQPNDEVEYTLYFWNNGQVDLSQVQLCDELEPPSVLEDTTFQLQAVGTFLNAPSFTSPVGSLIQARSPLDPINGAADPLESGCVSNPGTFPSGPPGPFEAGGGVVAGQFSVPVNQYGAVRFRVTIP